MNRPPNSLPLIFFLFYHHKYDRTQLTAWFDTTGLTQQMSRQLAQGARILGLTANDTVFKEGSHSTQGLKLLFNQLFYTHSHLGDRGHSFYIVLSGQMAVSKKRKLLTVRGPG